jgi:hypothetical protein
LPSGQLTVDDANESSQSGKRDEIYPQRRVFFTSDQKLNSLTSEPVGQETTNFTT